MALIPNFQKKVDRFLEEAKAQGFDLRITSGYRSPQEQQALYEQGRTKPGNIVTNAKGLPVCQSSHCKGIAIDIVDRKKGYNIDWAKLAKIGKACGMKWGGDWASFPDKPHFEDNGSVINNGGDMTVTPSTVDKVFKMGFPNREPTAAELGNPQYAKDPNLLVDTVWNESEGVRAALKCDRGDVLNFMHAVYKLDITKPELQKEAAELAKRGWKEAMYGLAAKYQDTIGPTKFKKIEAYVPLQAKEE